MAIERTTKVLDYCEIAIAKSVSMCVFNLLCVSCVGVYRWLRNVKELHCNMQSFISE